MILTTETQIQPQDAPLGRLPFTFAKRNGVILTRNDSGDTVILVRPGAPHSALAEANRISGGRARFESIDPDHFDAALNSAYQNDSAEAMQMVEGIGDDMDLASLAESVPETEDLLEQEDDAPIIRLINAILTEAVKSGASDVHIETYEKRLVVRFRVKKALKTNCKLEVLFTCA